MTGNEKFRLKVVDDLRKNRVIVESDEDYITLLKKTNKDLGDLLRLRDEQIAALTAERDELLEANRIACEDLTERHDRIVELKQQRDELLVVLEELSLYVAYNGDDWVQKKAKAVIASVKEKQNEN